MGYNRQCSPLWPVDCGRRCRRGDRLGTAIQLSSSPPSPPIHRTSRRPSPACPHALDKPVNRRVTPSRRRAGRRGARSRGDVPACPQRLRKRDALATPAHRLGGGEILFFFLPMLALGPTLASRSGAPLPRAASSERGLPSWLAAPSRTSRTHAPCALSVPRPCSTPRCGAEPGGTRRAPQLSVLANLHPTPSKSLTPTHQRTGVRFPAAPPSQ